MKHSIKFNHKTEKLSETLGIPTEENILIKEFGVFTDKVGKSSQVIEKVYTHFKNNKDAKSVLFTMWLGSTVFGQNSIRSALFYSKKSKNSVKFSFNHQKDNFIEAILGKDFEEEFPTVVAWTFKIIVNKEAKTLSQDVENILLFSIMIFPD